MKKRLNMYVIIIAILSIIVSLSVVPNSITKNLFENDKGYKLGLDLQGGIELDYYIDLSDAKKIENYNEASVIEGLKSIVEKRVATLNINDSVISSTDYAGEKHILVQIPMKGNNEQEIQDNIEKAKEAIGNVVRIEFKKKRTEITDEDIEERKTLATTILEELQAKDDQFDSISKRFRNGYENVTFGTLSGSATDFSELFSVDYSSLQEGVLDHLVDGTGIEGYFILQYLGKKDNPNYLADLGKNTEEAKSEDLKIELDNTQDSESQLDEENILETSENEETIEEKSEVNEDDKYLYNFNFIFVTKSPSDRVAAADSNGRILNDQYFEISSVDISDGIPKVQLRFNSEGAKIFKELTTELTGQQIAIFVGGEMLTDPVVNEIIPNGVAVITGNYSLEEAKALSTSINAGVIPAPIYLTSESAIDSKLGDNSLNKLLFAGMIGLILITIFLISVYKLSGILASISLIIYTILLLFIVKTFGLVMTLASIAGIILSIGMAIDSNVLIFERTKEQLRNGKKMKEAFIDGFDNSFSAIFDSNITGIITSLILYIFGVNMIKGFGLMFGIGLVLSLFTVLFVSRILILWLVTICKSEKLIIGKIKK